MLCIPLFPARLACMYSFSIREAVGGGGGGGCRDVQTHQCENSGFRVLKLYLNISIVMLLIEIYIGCEHLNF